MKLFIEDMKGYNESYRNVRRISIKKVDNKNTLIIERYLEQTITIPLNEIRLAFMINLETMDEYFRYEK